MTTVPPTLAQVEAWEKLVAATFPDHLIECLCEPELVQAEWAAVLAHLGASENPGQHTATLLSALATWLVAVWPLVTELLPGHLDMLFPVLVAARHKLTLRLGQAIIAHFPRFVHDQWGAFDLSDADTPAQRSLKLGMAYTALLGRVCDSQEYEQLEKSTTFGV